MTRHGRRKQVPWGWRLLLAGLVTGLVTGGGAAHAEPPAAAGAYRFVALACVQLDARCPAQIEGPGLAVTAAPPPSEADLVALLKAAPPAAGWVAPGSPWLVAVGPLQASSQGAAGPRLRSLNLDGHSLTVELDYTPYSPVGEPRRRHVPSYPVACVSLPALPTGSVRLNVRWTPRDAPGSATLLGPLLLLVP